MKFISLVKHLIVKRRLRAGFLAMAVVGVVVVGMAMVVDQAQAAKEEAKAQAGELREAAHTHGEAHEHEEKIAVLTDAQLKTADIGLAQVGPATINETLALYGTVEANGEKIQHVGAPYIGTVRRVNKNMGDEVRAGEVLAVVESNDSLKTYPISSALNGVVAERNINVGEQTSGQAAFVVVDLSTVWVDVDVFPRDAAKVHVNQAVRVSNPANNISAEGKIIAIAPLGEISNQSLSARVLLTNVERHWVPGLFVNVDVMMAEKSAALAVRNEAVQNHDGKRVVFVKGEEGFEPRVVKLGRTDGEFTEVLSGLSAGETYASKNSYIIKADLGKDGVEHED